MNKSLYVREQNGSDLADLNDSTHVICTDYEHEALVVAFADHRNAKMVAKAVNMHDELLAFVEFCAGTNGDAKIHNKAIDLLSKAKAGE